MFGTYLSTDFPITALYKISILSAQIPIGMLWELLLNFLLFRNLELICRISYYSVVKD
jgi:hypothetical protein